METGWGGGVSGVVVVPVPVLVLVVQSGLLLCLLSVCTAEETGNEGGKDIAVQ